MSSATDVLAAARSARATRDAAEVALARSTVDWCAAHRVDEDQAMWLAGYGDRGLTLGGPGCPYVRESAVVEYAGALGLSTAAGASYVGDVLELRYRLPRLWDRVLSGACPVWRARRVAARTATLCEDGADHVDQHVAGFAHSLSLAQLERVLDDALARFDPGAAEQKRRADADQRHATLDLDHVSETGVVEVRAALDLPDALDLDAALSERAAALGRLGCPESLRVRRSLALGDLARGQDTLDGPLADDPDVDARGRHRPKGRAVVLDLHLAHSAVVGFGEAERGRLGDQHPVRGSLLAEALRDWCATAATIHLRPVLDLAEAIHCESYEASDRLSDQTRLRDRTCAFPFCTRPAPWCDDEHPVPYPLGPTATHNQAPLCRRHHRAKTFLNWAYVVLTPGLYLWTSPTGLRYLRSHVGTHEIDACRRTGPPPDPLPQRPARPRRMPPLPPGPPGPAMPATGADSPGDPPEDAPPPF